LAIADSSSGAASASAMNVWARRQDQCPADDLFDGVQAELEAGRNTEVAPAAADGPEEVRMRLGVRVQQLAVGRDHLSGQKVVDRQAVLANEKADAAAQSDAADSH
jgi:hypothetical protein